MFFFFQYFREVDSSSFLLHYFQGENISHPYFCFCVYMFFCFVLFTLAAFKIFSLLLTLENLIIMYFGVVFFMFLLLGGSLSFLDQ